MKEWLVFDAMGVVYEVGDDVKDLLIPYLNKIKPGLEEDKINELYRRASLGEFSSKEFWQALGLKNWQQVEKAYLDTCLTIDRDFVKTVEQLSKEYNLAMLSNDVGEWSAYLRKRFDLDRLFKAVIISGDVGYRKPDRKIYEILLERINAPAESCTFFDDRVKNLITARELGMKAILFDRDRVNSGGFRRVNGFGEIEEVLNNV